MTDSFSAFEGDRRLVSGLRATVIRTVKQRMAEQPAASVLIFDDVTGGQIDFDLRDGGDGEAAPSPGLEAASPRGPGRPKLGVVAREVTLLPRHWDWLARQPGGASVTIRKLVDEARRSTAGAETARVARERAYRFMSAMGGNLSGFEEATRALFAGDSVRFATLIRDWPNDVRVYAQTLAEGAFAQSPEPASA